MNTYEINEFEEVVPSTSGRKCTDTRAYRQATELELQQRDEIKDLEAENVALKDRIAELEGEGAEKDRVIEALAHMCARRGTESAQTYINIAKTKAKSKEVE